MHHKNIRDNKGRVHFALFQASLSPSLSIYSTYTNSKNRKTYLQHREKLLFVLKNEKKKNSTNIYFIIFVINSK